MIGVVNATAITIPTMLLLFKMMLMTTVKMMEAALIRKIVERMRISQKVMSTATKATITVTPARQQRKKTKMPAMTTAVMTLMMIIMIKVVMILTVTTEMIVKAVKMVIRVKMMMTAVTLIHCFRMLCDVMQLNRFDFSSSALTPT